VDMASSFGKALLEFIFIVMAAITLLIGVNAGKSKAAGKVLYPATFTCGIAAIAYFAMASGGGWVIAPDCRQLFVARYLDWAITTPLILIDLGVVAGVSKWDILGLCLSDVLMVACGAFGALTVGNVKWVWWFFGMCWFLHIIFALGKSWAEAAKSRGGESGAVYSKLAGLTVIVWFAYPIVWVFAEGFGNFSVTFEVLIYGVLDLIAKCVFGLILMSGASSGYEAI
jgi:bacteriorhodopsin